MRRISTLLAGLLLAASVSAETTITVFTDMGGYMVVSPQGSSTTTSVIGITGGKTSSAVPVIPILSAPSTQRQTYITPTGTYMSIPMGKTTQIIQVSGARK